MLLYAMSKFRKKALLLCGIFFMFSHLGWAQVSTIPSQVLLSLVQKALNLDESSLVLTELTSLALKQKTVQEKKYVLTTLASYEEGLGELEFASKHYLEAAWLEPQRDWSLSLDAARCYIALGDHEAADSLVKAVLLGSFNQKELVRARVYGVILQLGGSERANALNLCAQYSKNPDFAEYAPMLLFLQWWISEDEQAKKNLLTHWSSSVEALIVQGSVNLSPKPFWYLAERDVKKRFEPSELTNMLGTQGNTSVSISSGFTQPLIAESSVASEKAVDISQGKTTSSSGRIWQQTGFFRNEGYAKELQAKLVSLGFSAIIRSETRSSGTTYYSVLVPETDQRSTGAQLKNAGFESSLVIDP